MSITDLKKPRGGRPLTENPKTCKIQIRVTEQEREAIRQIAESRGITMSALLVISALEAQARS
jgi:uncharacterized protein (DUF1778 family)